jgi:hypothetical protein
VIVVEDTDWMLTTVDNPYDPFTQYEDWYTWDFNAGYHTPGALARQVVTSNDLSEADQAVAIAQAVDDLVDLNPFGMYRKVSRK